MIIHRKIKSWLDKFKSGVKFYYSKDLVDGQPLNNDYISIRECMGPPELVYRNFIINSTYCWRVKTVEGNSRKCSGGYLNVYIYIYKNIFELNPQDIIEFIEEK